MSHARSTRGGDATHGCGVDDLLVGGVEGGVGWGGGRHRGEGGRGCNTWMWCGRPAGREGGGGGHGGGGVHGLLRTHVPCAHKHF